MDFQLKRLLRRKQPQTQPPALPPESEPESDRSGSAVMSFLEHLDELRKYMFRAIIALGVTCLVSFLFADKLMLYLMQPYLSVVPGAKLQILGPTEGVVVYFRVALLAGAVLALPLATFQLWQFIAPGLTKRERRMVYLSIPATTGLFLVGVAFAWFILMPAAIRFLSDFQDDIFLTEWTADQYIAFVTALIFWIGLAFEMPLVFYILSRLGMVGPRALMQNWRIAIVASAVLAAMITPTIDPFNMMLVMGPLLALYGLSIVLVFFGFRRSGVGPV